MDTVFSDALRKARREAGFSTAYRFFYDNGGTQALGFTYRQYLRMEQGKNLPECPKLCKLIFALRTTPGSASTAELAKAWLKMITGEEAYGCIFEPLLPAKTENAGLPFMHTAVKNLLRENKHYITHEQFRVILTDPGTFLCFTAISNDVGLWSVDQIAQELRLESAAAAKALKTLAGAGLLKRVKENVYKCPFAAMMLEYPHLNTVEPALKARLEKYERELTATGLGEWTRTGIVRADYEDFLNFIPVMFFIEGRVVRLRDF
ncbi:MAG: hypothetical protein HY746_00725 [Elusimicrobia bacterium]|nr:hypothetical protein [Elusimicrobiota bacterium]